MACEGDNVDVHGFHIDGDLAGGLGGVDQEGDAPFTAERADLCDGLNSADDVGPMVDDHQGGVGPHPSAELFGVDEPFPVEGDVVNGHSLLEMEVVERPKNRVVFNRGGDGMASWFDQAEDGQVESVGGVIGKDQPVGIFTAEEAAEKRAGLLKGFPRFEAEIVARTTGVDTAGAVEGIHEGVDLFRFGKRGGAVVEVDTWNHRMTS